MPRGARGAKGPRAWLFVALSGALACCSSSGPPGVSSGSATTSDETSSSASGVGGETGSSGSGSGAGGASGGMTGTCVTRCAAPEDCCYAGQSECPGEIYPLNYTCNNGLCGVPECAGDSDCASIGAVTSACVVVSGKHVCARACAVNEDCPSGQGCSGEKRCVFVCTSDAQCNGKCKGGACVCGQDSDCDPTATCVK